MELHQQDSMARWARSMEAQVAQERARLQARPVATVARDSGARWEAEGQGGGGVLSLAFFDQRLTVPVPSYEVQSADGQPVPMMTQALVTTYLRTANGAPRAGRWIAFRELPNGAFYHAAFTGYTGGLLARQLGEDIDAFRHGSTALGGSPLALGDAGYEFRPLPRLWVAVVYWRGDAQEGFPAQASVLFDASAPQYLVTDGLAIIGSQLIHRILAGAGG